MTLPTDGQAEPGSGMASAGQVPAERLRAVLDGMFDGVWMVDPAGRTTHANAAMAGLFALSRADMEGRSLNEFLDPSLWGEADAFLERQRTSSGEWIEFEFMRADGRELLGLLAGSPIKAPDGTYAGTMLNFSDVTGKRAIAAVGSPHSGGSSIPRPSGTIGTQSRVPFGEGRATTVGG